MTQRNRWRPALELRRRQNAYQALVSSSILLLVFSLEAAIPSNQAFEGSHGLSRQSTQQSLDKASGGGDEKDVRALEAGKPIKGELAGGRRHASRVALNANQFLKVIVEQQGIDIVTRVSGPDGKQILEFDSESRLRGGQEEASLVAEVAVSFQLIVSPTQNGAPAGSYEIPVRAAIPPDSAFRSQ